MQTDQISETEISQDFLTLLKLRRDEKDDGVKYEDGEAAEDNQSVNEDEDEVEDEDADEDEEEFSFICGEVNTSPIAAEDAFLNGQIKTVYPLFNRDLLFAGDDSVALHENLPMSPPVKKVFVETREATSSTVDTEPREWSERKAVEASPEICKKSNSTGFSKIWRFKDLLGRSNSDGRDTFVFLNNGEHPAPPPASKGEEKSEKEAAVKVKGKAKKGAKTKGKTTSLSAHEAYLKSKAKGEERRRSYLPYRPELMGFFTNVNGGLTKNVHPF